MRTSTLYLFLVCGQGYKLFADNFVGLRLTSFDQPISSCTSVGQSFYWLSNFPTLCCERLGGYNKQGRISLNRFQNFGQVRSINVGDEVQFHIIT